MRGEDRGIVFKIELRIDQNFAPIGPNPILSEQKGLIQIRSGKQLPKVPKPPLVITIRPDAIIADTEETTSFPGTRERLYNLIERAYMALNFTQPALTQACWLCLASSPPYYEGIAITGNITYGSSIPEVCKHQSTHKLTLPQREGQGTCLGVIPQIQVLCNQTLKLLK